MTLNLAPVNSPIFGVDSEYILETATHRRSLLKAGSALAFLMLTGTRGALAQSNYPSRPIKFIVPLPPGSPLDALGRRVGDLMSSSLGVPVILDNRPGAGATIGATEVSRAAPDGYTLLLTVAEAVVSGPATIKVSYDPLRDFRMISKIAASTSGAVLIASSKVKANNLAELIAEAKASSNPITYASFGPGSYPQQIMETLAKQAGLKFTGVPYRGSPPALLDVVAGQVDLTFASVEQGTQFIASGKIKPIAIMDKSPTLPQVQTFAEGGFSAFVFRNKPWVGLMGPAALPDVVVEKLMAAINVATRDPGFKTFLAGMGFEAIGNTPSQFLDELRAEMAVVPAIIRDLGITPQ